MAKKDAIQTENDEVEVDDLDEASEVIPFTYSITSYGSTW